LASSGTALRTICRPVASQPLSTEDRIGVSGSPLGGQTVSFSPVRWSYQLKYCPLGPWRSMRWSVESVTRSRRTGSVCPMSRSRSAATALHM
jgi:hypothetical protein